MSAWSQFMEALGTPGAVSAGVGANGAALDPRESVPDPDDITEASADRAEHAGDGDDIEPVYESARALAAEVVAEVVRTAPARLLGVPVPVSTAVLEGTPHPDGAGFPVQVVPASGGRPRTVIIRNISGSSQAVKLYVERAGAAGAASPPPGGFTLPDGGELETTTQHPIYAAATAAWSLSIWIDHYVKASTPQGDMIAAPGQQAAQGGAPSGGSSSDGGGGLLPTSGLSASLSAPEASADLGDALA